MSTSQISADGPRNPLLAELSVAVGGFLLTLGLLQEYANLVSRRKRARQ
jgi:hypothetical protein